MEGKEAESITEEETQEEELRGGESRTRKQTLKLPRKWNSLIREPEAEGLKRMHPGLGNRRGGWRRSTAWCATRSRGRRTICCMTDADTVT